MSRLALTRNLRLAFLGVLLFASAQVFWWIFDLGRHGEEDVQLTSTLYQNDAKAAAVLMERGVAVEEVEGLFPHLRAGPGGVAAAPESMAQLRERADRRKNQYRWEGGFFLLVLVLMMLILRRTIEAEAELRRRQEDFVAAVSHEIKSPLASLQLSVETIERLPLDDEKRSRYYQRIRSDVNRLNGMVSNILDSTKLARGDVLLQPEPFSVDKLVRVEVQSLEGRATERQVAITVDVPEEAQLWADPTASRVVVRNLLENAVHATAAKGGGTVAVSFLVDGSVAELTVLDDGIGFPPEEASRLFEDFYRVGSELTRETPGTGLGLAIVARYLKLEGALIEAHSEGPGTGARFVVRWPRNGEAA